MLLPPVGFSTSCIVYLFVFLWLNAALIRNTCCRAVKFIRLQMPFIQVVSNCRWHVNFQQLASHKMISIILLFISLSKFCEWKHVFNKAFLDWTSTIAKRTEAIPTKHEDVHEILVPLHSHTPLMCEPVFNRDNPISATWYKNGIPIGRVSSSKNLIYKGNV